MNGDQIYFLNQNLKKEINEFIQPNDIKNKFKNFIKEWVVDGISVYSKNIVNNGGLNKYFVEINLGDIESYDKILAKELRLKPLSYINLLEDAAKEHYQEININNTEIHNFQVQIMSDENIINLRELNTEFLNRLINIEGIIINSGKILFKGYKIVFVCKYCSNKEIVYIEKGFSGYQYPLYCKDNTTSKKCTTDPFYIDNEESEFIDFQILKIQEIPENLPSGEIPRTYQLCVEKYLVDKLKPGSKVLLTGIYSLIEKSFIKNISNTMGIRMPYIICLGFQNKEKINFDINFTSKDIENFKEFSNKPNIIEELSKFIAPMIYGHENIKKAISCMLFSGSSKILKDKTKLRGDINLLLLGDPSTAKSQFLKFVHKLSPISVYTSGKGSSAAGLTAAIIKDSSTREFQLEGGALVLADGGIVCIDEFDKMRIQDRVAIHEAMEQQTISISKAGISTVLNSRTSILAAANPIFGNIDDFKSVSDQIDLQTTILSRFDCIFLVKDIKNFENDKKMASHIMQLHTNTDNKNKKNELKKTDFEFLKKFIIYAKMNINPRLSDEAALILKNYYLSDRKRIENCKMNKKHFIPITIRQLEAIIRLSESIAKMKLSDIVYKEDVVIAHKLFSISTMNTISSGLNLNGINSKNQILEIQNIEEFIKTIIIKGNKIDYIKLIDKIKLNYNNKNNIATAINNLVKKNYLKHLEKSNLILRIN